ncbi:MULTISPECIES: nuclear transport factor 2 family protein [unclassified Mycobacterium]|uniref:nuclear transport factor 2 family protein n=1 Tax=unclassified Mycobacterium TaxID=2642494 RepID=UPI0029C6916D|nr:MULTISPECIES: nuclear transport factor 2 family protein [unclassified Mycobacterium]
MTDLDEISALLHRYARAVDTKDWELYRSVFTADAVIDYSSNGIPAGARDEITDFLAKAFTAIPMSMHYITNIEADVGSGGQERSDRGHLPSDTAKVRAMFYNPTQLPGLSELSHFGGYYFHELVRTDDGWRSRHLREEAVWAVNGPGG